MTVPKNTDNPEKSILICSFFSKEFLTKVKQYFTRSCRSVGYTYVFPQFLESYSFSPESANEVVIEKGLRQVTTHLEILENKYLEKSKYLAGNKLTVSDSCAAAVLVLLEWTGFSFKMWPKVESWLSKVKQQMFWDEVHTTHTDFVRELERANLVQRWTKEVASEASEGLLQYMNFAN